MQSPSLTLNRQDGQCYMENMVSLAVDLLMYTSPYRALEDIENTSYRLLLM